MGLINQAPTIDPAASYLTIEEYVKVRKEIMWDISFISPVFLAGILASILPLIIHFFIRKNVETIPFSFIHFLEMASQKKLRRVKLSRILLLLVRMLILILVALALAKPFMHAYGGMSLSKGENSSTVILLDNSYSMSMIDTNVTRLDQAKDEVRAILNLMSERDEICIIPFSSKNSPVLKSPGFTHDKMRLIQELNNIKISPYTTDIGEALKTADRLFRKSVNRSKTIIIITDLQKSGWSTVPAHGIISPEIKINIVNVGQKNASNTAVTKVEFPPRTVKGQAVRFSALIKNFGGERISDKIVSLVIDDQRVVSQRISIDPFGEKKISMYYTFNLSGIHSGYIETGEDFMPIDNKYFFSIRVIDKIRILSVNGRPGTSPLNDETFYLDTVLNPSGDENSIFKITEIKQNELNKIEFSDFDIYIFSNVSELSPLHIKVLEQCVKGGAGILFFMGDSVLPEKYNEEIFKNGSGIFPSRISYQISSSSNADVQNENYFFINSIELKHPIFSILQDETLKVLQRIPFYSFYRFEFNELIKDVKVLAKFNDGLPALIEKEYGKGRVLVFASSAGLKWNKLALMSIFPTMIHQFIRYLVFYNTDEKLNYTIGNDVIPLKSVDYISPGIYKVEYNSKKINYAVNLNFSESDLESISEEEIIKKIGTGANHLSFSLPVKNFTGPVLAGWFKGEIWKILFIVLLLLIVIETLVANHFRKGV